MKKLSSISILSLQHYVLIRKWSSDIEFFKIETSFLHRLLDKNFVRLINSQRVEELKISGEDLLRLERNESKTNLLLRRQLKEMEWIAKNVIQENTLRITDSRVELECEMANLTREFQQVKKNIFKLIERPSHKDRFVVC